MYSYSNGDKYEGEWLDGLYHGQGLLVHTHTHTHIHPLRFILKLRDMPETSPESRTQPADGEENDIHRWVFQG